MKTADLVLAVALASLVGATAGAQERTANPHGKLEEECAVCHSPEGWVPARVSAAFDHSKKGFALVGSHAQAACRSCHVSLDFRGASSACTSCHKDIHRGELGTDCARCHTPRSFLDLAAMTRAHRLTRFPLSGAHLAVDCEACHTPTPQGRMAFANLPTQCVACHLAQYQTAKNPDHVASGFPQTCDECHAATIWSSSRFNHAAVGFALTGGHSTLTCQQCHGTGGFTLTSTACVSCHLQDYNGTTNPGHAAAGFPTTCEACHTTGPGWTGASFNHTWFVIPHHSAQCSDCHTSPTSYTAFVCTNCHGQSGTTSQHQGVSGFVWNSANCYGCHRQ